MVERHQPHFKVQARHVVGVYAVGVLGTALAWWFDPWLVRTACVDLGCGSRSMAVTGWTMFMFLPSAMVLAVVCYGRVRARPFWVIMTVVSILALPAVGSAPAPRGNHIWAEIVTQPGGRALIAGFVRASWSAAAGFVVLAIGNWRPTVKGRALALRRYPVVAWCGLASAWGIGLVTLVIWPPV
jgi:hypothetical protein